MYAVKTNDADVVIQLLTPGGEKPGTRGDDSGFRAQLSGVNLGAKDSKGYGVLHHLIEVTREPKVTFDNAVLMKLLMKAGCDPKEDIVCPWTGKRKATWKLADEMGATAIGKVLKGPTVAKKLEVPAVKDCVEDWDWEMYDVHDDAQRMLKILEEKAAEEEREAEKLKRGKEEEEAMEVDDEDDDGDMWGFLRLWTEKKPGVVRNQLKDKPDGCSATKDAVLYKGYTVLMQKIDVKYGAWGMYNFYRMQVSRNLF